MQQVEYKIQIAESFEREGKLLHALQIYHILLKHKKYKRTAVIRLADIYQKFGKLDKAVLLFEDYLFENLDIEMRKYFAHYLIKNEIYEKALDVLEYISKESNPEVYFLTGLANYKLKNYEIAKINFSEFVRKNKRSDLLPEAYLFLSKSYRRLNQYDLALENAKLSEMIWNRNFELYLNLAKIYFYKEMYLHAFEAISKAIKINNKDYHLYKWAGKILYYMDEYEKAEVYLKKFVTEGDIEQEPEIFALLGGTYLKCKKYKEAKVYFELCLKIDPSNTFALKGKNDCAKFAS